MAWILALLAVGVTTLWAWLMCQFERPLRAPWLALTVAFAWGALPSTLVSLGAQNILLDWANAQFGREAVLLLYSTVFTGLIEELAKGGGMVLLFFWQREHFKTWRQGIVYGAVVGLGFALFEHIKFLFEAPAEEQLSLFVRRVLLFGLSHAFYTGLIGIGLGLARSSSSRAVRSMAVIGGFAAAVVTHALNNTALALTERTDGLSFLGVCGNYLLLAGLYVALYVSARRAPCAHRLDSGSVLT
ncbi:MAG: PrsW family intramembrane metalloprotease [Anaerolineae bacterium]|nr:PrsW family intramembrane metalloprotease [Thermoflexales bacterium]MDW8396124.1 PrsW family intramembrane metalloprotease [Anaerolineae bacterium]